MAIKHKDLFFDYPEYWPKPNYDFSKLSMSENEFQLGRQLFYDPILSRDNTISCASCHLQATGFTHVDHDLSHGIDGRIGTRNSMTIMNLAWNTSFMWDGGVNHLELQALAPISSENEMDETLANVVDKLNESKKYKSLFFQVHQDSLVTGQKTFLALTQFVVMLNSYNSKYDKYIRKEAGGDFTEQEKNGLSIFRENCASCHKEPLFTINEFKNNGLKVDTTLNDYGRMLITQNSKDSLKFKVPTLRNIQFTAPYMHDGRFETLQEVLDHYTADVQESKTLATELKKTIQLSHIEKVDLLVFLRTLTDKEFLFDKRFSFPNNNL
ncbi:cytochrome C peroxidase [unidentified eubacterium SCB49]|nr:cytochrome C peroxidase [unidentified eubacterium SCB49]